MSYRTELYLIRTKLYFLRKELYFIRTELYFIKSTLRELFLIMKHIDKIRGYLRKIPSFSLTRSLFFKITFILQQTDLLLHLSSLKSFHYS